MGYEFERKYLVLSDDWGRLVLNTRHLVQGYVSRGPLASTRVRIDEDVATLTVKGSESAEARPEYNLELATADAHEMLRLLTTSRIEKLRHTLDLGPATWTVDEFLGESEGLVLLEVEADQPLGSVQLPDWVGADVTTDGRYSNSFIDLHPYKTAAWKRGPTI